MRRVFHITDNDSWASALKRGHYTHASLKAEGFIHCSFAEQIIRVANKYYRGLQDLVLLEINPHSLNAELRIEGPRSAPASGELYPHLYGPLNTDAVTATWPMHTDDGGIFVLPQGCEPHEL